MGEEKSTGNGIMDANIEELTEDEVREVRKIFDRFIKKYQENPEKEIVEWLVEQLREELPDKGEEEIRQMAEDITSAVLEYDRDLEDLNVSCKKGITKEAWLADKLQDSAKGIAVNEFGDYLSEVDKCLAEANQQMARTVQRMDGGISQNVNLDGFIAEQYHVNNFNAKAVLEKSDYRARVCVPEGKAYGKNSVDVAIDNIKTGQRGVARYQFKFGKDGGSTTDLLEEGNYNNQRLVVPQGQVEEVRNAYPNKTVTDYIGGTDEIKTRSDSLTKEQIKEMQLNVQKEGIRPKIDWNSYQTKEMALNIGKQAGNAGVQAAFVGMGINLAQKALSGEEIEGSEVVETALKTGTDTCVKSAAGGALKVASEKGMISLLPPGTPAGTLAKIACVGVENVKILWKVAKGELTMSEALEHMGRTSVSMYAGLSAGAVGAGIGAAALGFVPVVGPVIGGIVGGIVGYTAGSKVGETVFNGARKVVKKGIEIVGRAAEGIKNFVSGVADTLLGWLPF